MRKVNLWIVFPVLRIGSRNYTLIKILILGLGICINGVVVVAAKVYVIIVVILVLKLLF